MIDFRESRGEFKFSIGEGYLSLSEIGRLKPGDIVKVSRFAGEPGSFYFNGNFLGSGEVVAIGNVLGTRVTNLSESPSRGPELTGYDDVTEILPTMISMGSIELSISELKGVGPGSIISFGKPWNEKNDAILLAEGIAIAEGKVICIYENFGIRIVKMLVRAFKAPLLRNSGFLIEKDFCSAMIKDYNFKRPDKFTRIAIERIADVHRLFTANLRTSPAGTLKSFDIDSVDQLTFEEIFPEIEGDCNYILATNMPIERPYSRDRMQVLRNKRPGKLLVEEESTPHPVGERDREFISNPNREKAPIWEIPLMICLKGSYPEITEEQAEILLSCLRSSWRNITDFNFRLKSVSRHFEDIKVIADRDMIAAVFMSDKSNPDRKMFIIHPYITLEPILKVLNL